MRGTRRFASTRRSSMWVTTAMGASAGGGEPILRRVVEKRQAVITDRLVRCRRRFRVVRCERRDEIGEPGERAGANADQAQAPRQVDSLQAGPGGAPDRARVEGVRR